jgi:hypothetical protein
MGNNSARNLEVRGSGDRRRSGSGKAGARRSQPAAVKVGDDGIRYVCTAGKREKLHVEQ